jgi:23S rRNA pseudouridine2605 synthase
METEGLLILTDNGDVAQEITHPSAGIGKHYEAVISRPLPGSLVPKLLAGIEDGGEFLKFDKIIPIGRGHMRGLSFEIVLSQGKKNEIHRVFGHFGIFVKRLRRTRIGGLTMRGVGPGKCRLLGEKEIALLLHKSF